MVGDPPVLLLDEPSGDLDGDAEIALGRGLRELAQDHTILVATHSPTLLTIADSILVLERGKVALAGPAKQVLQKLRSGLPQRGAGPAPANAPPANGSAAAE